MLEGSELYQYRLKKFTVEVSVYPVSCERLAAGRSDIQWLEAVLQGGAKIVQLRDKDSEDRDLLAKALYFRKKTKEAGALFIINDRLDIAMLADADGVHVGQKDLPPEEVRRLVPDMLIGVSCNTREQAIALGELEKQEKMAASYFNIGPLYQTCTKDGLSVFIGTKSIKLFSSFCSLPFTVMGGIKLHHIPEVVRAGARRIAVVTAVSQAEDIAAETAEWVTAVERATGECNG